jgi:hypothetical protein
MSIIGIAIDPNLEVTILCSWNLARESPYELERKK